MFLQEKAEAAPNRICKSSCSALPKKVCSDGEFSFSAILVTHNKVCLLAVYNKGVKYLLLLDSSYSKHSKDKPNDRF